MNASHYQVRSLLRYHCKEDLTLDFFQGMLAVNLRLFVFALLLASPLTAQDSATLKPDEVGYRRVAPFLKKYCIDCHGPDAQEGEFRIDQHLPNDFLNPAAKSKWSEVVNMLNSHEMPPEDSPQPSDREVARVVDWVTEQMTRAEYHRRDSAIVLRRMNREEYRNTIRDLLAVDYNPERFPQDPSAGGFDNNGGALTMSPLQIELYYEAAREILDLALVTGEQPPKIRWRFQPESGNSDSNRVEYDGQRLIVNGGKNRVEGDFVAMHHESWDRNVNVRDFVLPQAGVYTVRIRAGGVTPTRRQVVETVRPWFEKRMNDEIQKNPRGEEWHRRALVNNMKHMQTDSMYDYGSPRLKLIQSLSGQPKIIAEMDVDAPRDEPQVYSVQAKFNEYKTGVTIQYAYDIPKVLENFWFQTGDEFPRPELWIDWMEIEGPIYESWPPPSHRKLLPESPLQTSEPRQYARQVLSRFMHNAYRRPVSAEEIEQKMAIYDRAVEEGKPFIEAIKSPLSAVMVSPHFLYLVEFSGQQAEKPKPAPRRFTDARGRKMQGAVIKLEGDQVTIRRADGQQFTVSQNLFSPADQAYFRDLQQQNQSPFRPLDDFELANRLSYFLWSSMPDGELFRLARAGQLRDPQTLKEQAERMLMDPKSEAFVRNFAGQWLGLREVGANPPAPDLYPRYDRHLEQSIVRESEEFFAEILRNDLSVMNFVQSNFVVINERLARFYKIPGVRGDYFRRVQAPPQSHRGGVVTQASVLSLTSNGTRTSPVKRGVWVMKNILGVDPGLPVANAGDIAPKVPGIDKATVRKRLEIHRTLPQCARCHNKIDPLGFALENFNAAGEWRDREGFGYKGRIQPNDPPIDASAKMIDGAEFVGVEGLQTILMKRKHLFLQCLADKMMTYALGRELGLTDQKYIDEAVKQVRREDTLKALVQYVVASEPFRTK